MKAAGSCRAVGWPGSTGADSYSGTGSSVLDFGMAVADKRRPLLLVEKAKGAFRSGGADYGSVTGESK